MPLQEEFYQRGIEEFQWRQKVEIAICSLTNVSNLSSGVQIIRNDKGWRVNEKLLDYSWNITIYRSFLGALTMFALKFDQHTFRDIRNQTELVTGIIELNSQGEIASSYITSTEDISDTIAEVRSFNLFHGNMGITLDGTSYKVSIRSQNIESHISLNNPSSDEWLKVERQIYALGRKLALASGVPYYEDFFG